MEKWHVYYTDSKKHEGRIDKIEYLEYAKNFIIYRSLPREALLKYNEYYEMEYDDFSVCYDTDLEKNDPIYISRQDFGELVKGLVAQDYKKYHEANWKDYDLWKRYYTCSKKNPSLVDQIEINVWSKEYRLYLNSKDYITDGYDEFGEIYSCNVSRMVFDAIHTEVQKRSFKEIKE